MNYETLTDKQKAVILKLKPMFESQEQLHNWLSLPNKMFRSKPPIDLLISGNFDYFDRILNAGVCR
jgi:uncharacterized protein (DUF2384 family)